ncbi:MAG: diadenylate cyclase CdaA [Clostridia bacterium]|nr:diadenylate cyclase CdaA [Clostridia bacterium]
MQQITEIWKYICVYVDEYVISTIKQIGWLDVVDILLLSIIFFFLYRFVRDRRAGKLLIGVACVVILSLVGDALELPAIRFVFSDFRQIGVIAILILFQPELRSALEKVGGTPLSGIRNITDGAKDLSSLSADIDGICSAVSDLSREKVGALIVIERSTKLGEYVKSGVIVDATISPYLLRNIFFNNAPLHDGAVIIRAGRVCAAGCFLPLSTKEDIDKNLGTRHRAAIGMSEISDAIVIVVSEETGMISLSVDGNLKRNFNYNSLKQELNRMLVHQGSNDHAKKHRKEKRSFEGK